MIDLLSEKSRLIRAEYHFSQDKMAEILGLSKKTLIQIEKERKKMSWTAAVALCAIFGESEILQLTLGENPLEIVQTIALNHLDTPKNKTLGGKMWWESLKKIGDFRMQQNIISKHYRILDGEDYRWYSSFSKEDTEERFENLTKNSKEE